MVDQSAMTLFLSVIDEGSFSAAARKLGQTPSAVGKRVRALEERLGVDLLVRSTRKMALTEAGQRYVEDAREISARISALEEDLREGADRLRGTVRLTAPTAYGQRFVMPALTQFMSKHPAVDITMSLTDKVVDLVGDNVDLAVRTGTHPDSTLIGRRIGPYGRTICASPAYLDQAGAPRAATDIAHHRCLRLPSETSLSDWNLDAAGSRGTRLGAGLVCNSLDALAAACIAGQGIACIPNFIADAPLEEGRLKPVLDAGSDSGDVTTDILLLRPAHRHVARRVRALGDYLFNWLRQ